MTWSGQVSQAANLQCRVEGVQDNWFVATQTEIDQLFVQDIPSPQNALVAEAMGWLPSLHYGNGAYFRYNKVSSLPGGLFGQHSGVY